MRLGRLCNLLLAQRKDEVRDGVARAEVGRSIEEVVPVTAGQREIIEPESHEARVEMRRPFAGGEAVAARGLM